MSHHHHGSSPIVPISFPHLTRRVTLGGIGAAITLAGFRPARAAAGYAQRLVILNIKGGLDGLSAVIPYSEAAALTNYRASLVPPPIGQTGGMLPLDNHFALNPSLPNLFALYQAGQMLAVHSVSNILVTHSHFADQTALQSGTLSATSSGWMNRLVTQLSGFSGLEPGLVLSTSMPTIGQGQPPVGSFAGSPFPNAPNTLAALVETLAVNDPLIGYPTQQGFLENATFQNMLNGKTGKTASPFQATMQQAGIFINAPNGPAVVLVETGSVDTHTNQVSQLKTELSDLDAGFAALANASGAAWANTVVMTITEFGRKVAVNGSGGTDHGAGLAMFLAGGAVSGGRVLSPGGPLLGQLLNGVDLIGQTDIRSVIMGVLQDHMKLTTAQLATVFPNLPDGVTPLGGLVTN